jgi:hypothetical protein
VKESDDSIVRDAHIHLKSESAEIRFDWLGFDGDDCFKDFYITVTYGGQTRCFNFGWSAVYGLRKLSRFFADSAQPTVSGSFSGPDLRQFDLQRTGEGYRLILRFEGATSHEEFHIRNPSVHVADEFLKSHDAS